MFCYFTRDRAEAKTILAQQVSPALGRSPEELRDRILVCPAEEAVERLTAYRDAGAHLVFLWPVIDEINQLEIIAENRAAHRLTRRVRRADRKKRGSGSDRIRGCASIGRKWIANR